MLKGFAGLRIKKDKIYFDPKIPKQWESYSFKVNIKNRKIEIKIDQKSTSAKLISGDKINLTINDTNTILNK